MIISTSPFNLPFLILIWLIEMYLFMATARLIVSRIPSASQTHFCCQLKLLTDFLPEAVRRRMGKWRDAAALAWLPWFIVILVGFLLRQALIIIVTR